VLSCMSLHAGRMAWLGYPFPEMAM